MSPTMKTLLIRPTDISLNPLGASSNVADARVSVVYDRDVWVGGQPVPRVPLVSTSIPAGGLRVPVLASDDPSITEGAGFVIKVIVETAPRIGQHNEAGVSLARTIQVATADPDEIPLGSKSNLTQVADPAQYADVMSAITAAAAARAAAAQVKASADAMAADVTASKDAATQAASSAAAAQQTAANMVGPTDAGVAQLIASGAKTSAALAGSFERGDSMMIYVSANGSDSNNGLTRSAGKATIAAALTAMGSRPGVIILGPGTINVGSGVAWPNTAKCGMVGQGPGRTILAASNQAGPVLDLSQSGYNINDSEFGGFTILGDGTATTTNGGLKLSSTVSVVRANFHDITVKSTGGIPFDLGMAELCDFDRFVAYEPVNAAANDMPYMKAVGAFNGNRFGGLQLYGVSSGASVGPSGAVVIAASSSTAPHDNHFATPRCEYLHLADGATIFAFAGNSQVISDPQFFDCGKASGATGTSHIRLAKPAGGLDLGGNLVKGIIPGKGTNATDIDCGIDMRQSRNSVTGVKGFRGTNVIISAGVDSTVVDLAGQVGTSNDPAVIDNSGKTTNKIGDAALNVTRGNGNGVRVITSSMYYGPANHTPGTVNATQSTLYAIPLWLPGPTPITSIECQVTTAGAAGTVVRMGAYAPSTVNDRPTALLLDAGTIAADSTGVKAIPVTATLPAGLVWLTACCQGGTASFTSVGAGSLTPVVGWSFAAGMNAYIAPSVTDALPATFALYNSFTGGIKVMVKAA